MCNNCILYYVEDYVVAMEQLAHANIMLGCYSQIGMIDIVTLMKIATEHLCAN